MNRRGFLTAMLAAGAAPAVCKAENLMKIFVPPAPKVLTLDSLAADFDGDVHFSHMRDGLDRWRARLERNGQFGAQVEYPRGESPYFVHIDEAAFVPGDHINSDRDYFKAWTESGGNLEQTHRRLVTPRRGEEFASSTSESNIVAKIRRIKPQAGSLELPRDDRFKNVNLRPWNERLLDLVGLRKV